MIRDDMVFGRRVVGVMVLVFGVLVKDAAACCIGLVTMVWEAR